MCTSIPALFGEGEAQAERHLDVCWLIPSHLQGRKLDIYHLKESTISNMDWRFAQCTSAVYVARYLSACIMKTVGFSLVLKEG